MEEHGNHAELDVHPPSRNQDTNQDDVEQEESGSSSIMADSLEIFQTESYKIGVDAQTNELCYCAEGEERSNPQTYSE